MSIESVVANTAGAGSGSTAPVARTSRPTGAESMASSAPDAVRRTDQDDTQNKVSRLSVQEATEHLNRFVSSVRPEINFTVDEDSGARVVRVVDSNTQEVIRQIPSEEVIRMAQVLDKLQGLFVKEAV